MTQQEELPSTVNGEECPICREKTLTLTELEKRIPFGEKEILTHIFSMTCLACKYHKSDVEFEEQNDPVKYTLDVETEEDMNIRIVKSGEATIKIPHMITLEGGPTSNGYITNVEGLLKRVKYAIETTRDSAEDEEDKTKAKNMLKKLTRVFFGQEKVRIILEDKTGNSCIISEKAIKAKL